LLSCFDNQGQVSWNPGLRLQIKGDNHQLKSDVERFDGYTDRQNQLLAVNIICLILPTLVVAVRILTRGLIKVNLWWDDYCIIVALVRLLQY
jgi:hypothetical protein